MQKLAKMIYDDAFKNLNNLDFSKLQNKTILITGATGLIGTYFIASLKNLSDKKNIKTKVIAIAHSEPSQYWKDLLPEGYRIIKGDISDVDILKKLPKVDYIIHAAGYGQPGRFLENPIKTLNLNTLATYYLLEKLKSKGGFLFMSTSEVYSGSSKIPYHEDDIGTTNTMHKRACYIEGKRCGEAITMSYRDKGVDVKVARASLIYGPGTKKGDQRVLNSFIVKALNGKIEMLDSGDARRTYCYITDAIEMLWNILLFGKEAIYNVGGESKITIAGLAKKIGKYINAPIKIPRKDHSLSGAPDDVWLDLNKIKKEFKKNKFISLDQGLLNTIEWQKELYK